MREAADVLLTRLKDPNLALLITRLMEQVGIGVDAYEVEQVCVLPLVLNPINPNHNALSPLID